MSYSSIFGNDVDYWNQPRLQIQTTRRNTINVNAN